MFFSSFLVYFVFYPVSLTSFPVYKFPYICPVLQHPKFSFFFLLPFRFFYLRIPLVYGFPPYTFLYYIFLSSNFYKSYVPLSSSLCILCLTILYHLAFFSFLFLSPLPLYILVNSIPKLHAQMYVLGYLLLIFSQPFSSNHVSLKQTKSHFPLNFQKPTSCLFSPVTLQNSKLFLFTPLTHHLSMFPVLLFLVISPFSPTSWFTPRNSSFSFTSRFPLPSFLSSFLFSFVPSLSL